jgi:hypothetical protein
VYVGDSPTNYNYSLDTGQVTTKATVAGLSPSKTYVFAVTALQDTKESPQKSAPISMAALGITLEVLPDNSALTVRWSALSSTLPIDTFKFEYGTDPATLTEHRTLNGKLREFVMRDLLNGITYFIRITPITLTGEAIKDLSATGQGTPNGNGFVRGPHEDIPSNLTTPTIITVHPGAQEKQPTRLSDEGMPWSLPIAGGAVGCVAVLGYWYHSMQRRRTLTFLRAMRQQYERTNPPGS